MSVNEDMAESLAKAIAATTAAAASATPEAGSTENGGATVKQSTESSSNSNEDAPVPDSGGGGGGGGVGGGGGGNGDGDDDGSGESEPVDKQLKQETVDFKVIFNKKKYDVTFPLDSDVGALKNHLQPIISIPPAMMKVMIKGLAKDDMTLRKLGVAKGAKVMVVGSTLDQVLKVSKAPTASELNDESGKGENASKEATCKQKQHAKVLDKGKPEDVIPGMKNSRESLPSHPLSGMLNKHGGKVRLTFKMEVDQVWIGTKERTEKIPMNSIKNVVSEAIDGHEEYHILALQLGPTEASRYWIYWVPAQYVDAIKDAVLGKWQLF